MTGLVRKPGRGETSASPTPIPPAVSNRSAALHLGGLALGGVLAILLAGDSPHQMIVTLTLIYIGYAPKNDALMAEMGLEAFCQHVEQLDLKRLMVQFDALMAERAEHERRIRTVVNAFRDQLARQEAALATTLFADSQFAAAPRGAVDLSGPPRPTT